LHVLVGVVIGVVIFVVFLCSVVYILVFWVLQCENHHDQSLLHECQSRAEDLLFEDIMPAREGWSEKYVIGRSKHGSVFTGHNLQTPESIGLSRRWVCLRLTLASKWELWAWTSIEIS
jgi:hypothetical protein